MVKKNRIGTFISILIPVLLIIFNVNFIYKITLTVIPGLSIFLPIFLCPIGFLLAILSHIVDKNTGAKIGIILNVVVFLIPFIWMIYYSYNHHALDSLV
ncbi:amino acid carrier protein [Bacillus mycoides]|nr:amino acid carrier protein [Bacillus mycoides]